ncbi:MAG: MBL fold metallo-hydrolase, partial [Pseudomonadales bacterium]|nr:MBL fold metallo-hydrolase [Pseudomonadales bacterium]
DALLLECNHDVRMLAEGPYPWSLKQRVGGQHGHLNNEQAAGLLDHVVLEKLQHLVISHISEKNNAPALAVGAVGVPLQSAGQRWRGQMLVSEQDRGFGWLELN